MRIDSGGYLMKETRWIRDNICQYVFIKNKDKPYMDINITVLIDGKNAMLIDTAYSKQATIVKQDLKSKGITVNEIILSHYHPDHAAGATEFKDTKLSCSVHYKNNYKNCHVWDEGHNYRKPHHTILNKSTKNYGKFTLEFFDAPGHTQCSIITLIDGKIAHVGDLLMLDAFGNHMIPYICDDGNFQEHINSLEIIKTIGPEILVLSHGKHIVGKELIMDIVDMRIHYLKCVLESKGKADIEELLLGDLDQWAFKRVHNKNLTKLKI